MPTFGTAAGHDPVWSVSGGAPTFPTTGSTAAIRDSLTLASLGSVTFSSGGVWSYSSGAGVDYIDLQAPSGTWVGPFMSRERQQASATFLTVANAVQLSTATPAAASVVGFAGTAATATRGDHAHPLAPARPTAIGLSGTTVSMAPIGGGQTATLNRASFEPLWVTTPSRAALVCSTVGINVTTAASAGGTIRFGMWGVNTDGSINLANKLFETGEISSTTTGMKTFAYTTPIPEGLYWAGLIMHVATCSITGETSGMLMQGPTPGSTVDRRYVDGVTGAFPTSGATNNGGEANPALFFAVP